MFVLVTDYTPRKVVSANDQGILARTGRAHCQRQVAFILFYFYFFRHLLFFHFNEVFIFIFSFIIHNMQIDLLLISFEKKLSEQHCQFKEASTLNLVKKKM